MLEDISDKGQTPPDVNRREVHYKICDLINQRQSEWKGALLSTQDVVKGQQKGI